MSTSSEDPMGSPAVEKQQEPQSSDPGPPPDGGLQAWIQAVMGVLSAFLTWGFITSFGAFQEYYETQLLSDSSPSDISWIGSFQLFLIFAVGVFSGRMLDAGYFIWVYSAGCFFLVFGVMMTSLAKNYAEVFLAQAVCSGLGSGLLFTPAMGLVATWFSKKRVFVLSMFLTGAGVGGMVFPAVISSLLYRIGFPWTIRIVGFIMLAVSIVTIALFRTRLPPRRTGALVEWSAFREVPFVLYVTGMWFNFFALYFSFFYIGTYARDILMLSYKESVDVLITINGLGIIGRLLAAYVATYIGPVNAIIPCALVSSILSYCWITITHEGGIYAFAVFYGIFGNGVQGLFPGGLASLNKDDTKTGTRMGMGFTLASVALLVGTPVGGALISRDNGGYLYAQIWAGSSLMFGVCILICARIAATGFHLMRKA